MDSKIETLFLQKVENRESKALPLHTTIGETEKDLLYSASQVQLQELLNIGINNIPYHAISLQEDKIITPDGHTYSFNTLPANIQKLINNENEDNSLKGLNLYYQQEYNKLLKLKNKYSIADLLNFINSDKQIDNRKYAFAKLNEWEKELKNQEKSVNELKKDINNKLIQIVRQACQYMEKSTKINNNKKQYIEKEGKDALFPVNRIMSSIQESLKISPHSNYLSAIGIKEVKLTEIENRTYLLKRYYPKHQPTGTKFYWESKVEIDLNNYSQLIVENENQKFKKERLPLCFTSLGRDIDRAIHEFFNSPPYYRLSNVVEIPLTILVKYGLNKELQTKILEQVWEIIQDLSRWYLVYEFKQKNETVVLHKQPLYSIEKCFIRRNKKYPDSIILKHNFYHPIKEDKTPLYNNCLGQPCFGHHFILFKGSNITRKGFKLSLLKCNSTVGKKGRGEEQKLKMLDDLIRKKVRLGNKRTFAINEIELAERTGFSITIHNSESIRKLRSRLKHILEMASQSDNNALKKYEKKESIFTTNGEKQIEYILTVQDDVPCGGEIRLKQIERIKLNNTFDIFEIGKPKKI